MRFLRQSTAVCVTVGPFLDHADGLTPLDALTVANLVGTINADDDDGTPTHQTHFHPAASGSDNDMVTMGEGGFWSLELTTGNTTLTGRLMLGLSDPAQICPVFHEFMVLTANVYDSLIIGPGTTPDLLDVNTAQWLGTAAHATSENGTPCVEVVRYGGADVPVTTAGIPDVNLIHIVNVDVSATTAQLGVNVVNWLGTAGHAATVAGIPVVQLHAADAGGGINGPAAFPANFDDLNITDTTGLVRPDMANASGNYAGTVATVTTVTNQLTAAAIATGVWQDATAGDFTVASSIGKSLFTGGVVPGGTNGLFIAGTNAATVITTNLTTGAIVVTTPITADLTQIHGTALTETAGQLAAAFVKFFDVAAPTLTCLGVNQTIDNPTAAAIKTALEADGAKLDHLWEMTEDDGGVRRLTTNALEQGPGGGTGLTAQQTRDAMKLAPTAGDPAAGSLDEHLDSVVTLVAKFTGITVLANWLKGLFRKDAMDATAKTEANAGGGTYNEATDSQEAEADALAAAIGFRVSAGQPTFSLAGASTQALSVPQASHTDLVLIRDTLAGVPINITGKTVRMRVFDGTAVIMDLTTDDITEIVLTTPAAGVFTVHFTVALTATAGRFSYECWDVTTPTAEVLWASGVFEIRATHGPGA